MLSSCIILETRQTSLKLIFIKKNRNSNQDLKNIFDKQHYRKEKEYGFLILRIECLQGCIILINTVTYFRYREGLSLKFLLFFIQIEEFRRLRSHVKGAELLEGNDGLLGDNFRPTQPLSDRVVRAAFQ